MSVTDNLRGCKQRPHVNGLNLSFWDIELSNLPLGSFRKRELSADEARRLIDQARADKALLCVAEADLGAPYCAREREKHVELCEALREHMGIEISIKDFFGSDFAQPLCFAQVGAERSLLVVDCAYTFDGPGAGGSRSGGCSVKPQATSEELRRQSRETLKTRVAADTIRFYLVEQTGDAAPLPPP